MGQHAASSSAHNAPGDASEPLEKYVCTLGDMRSAVAVRGDVVSSMDAAASDTTKKNSDPAPTSEVAPIVPPCPCSMKCLQSARPRPVPPLQHPSMSDTQY